MVAVEAKRLFYLWHTATGCTLQILNIECLSPVDCHLQTLQPCLDMISIYLEWENWHKIMACVDVVLCWTVHAVTCSVSSECLCNALLVAEPAACSTVGDEGCGFLQNAVASLPDYVVLSWHPLLWEPVTYRDRVCVMRCWLRNLLPAYSWRWRLWVPSECCSQFTRLCESL
jgi:hypothetical protein